MENQQKAPGESGGQGPGEQQGPGLRASGASGRTLDLRGLDCLHGLQLRQKPRATTEAADRGAKLERGENWGWLWSPCGPPAPPPTPPRAGSSHGEPRRKLCVPGVLTHQGLGRESVNRSPECAGASSRPSEAAVGMADQEARAHLWFLSALLGRAGQRQPHGALPGSGDGRVPSPWGSEQGRAGGWARAALQFP